MARKRFAPLERTSSWRRIAQVMWQEHTSPQVLGFDEVDMTAVQAVLSRARGLDDPTRVTVTHLVVKALARVLEAHPDLNVVHRRGRIERRVGVDIFVQVAIPSRGSAGGADLSGVQIRDVSRKSARDIATELTSRASRVRSGDDPDIEKVKKLLDKVPTRVLRRLMTAMANASFELGVSLDRLGVKTDPFGVAMVTNCGGFGVHTGFAPLLPMARTPIIVLLGETRERPTVVDGEVVARPIMNIGGTFDHRLYDGFQIGLISSTLKQILESEDDLEALL